MKGPAAAWLLAALAAPPASGAVLQPATVRDWNRLVSRTEARIAGEIGAPQGFLGCDFLGPAVARRCREEAAAGGVCVLQLPRSDTAVRGGRVHHWLGSILVPGVDLDALLAWLQDYPSQPRFFADVVESRLLRREGDVFDVFLHLERRQVVTVAYDTEHHVEYRRLAPGRAWSRSAATRIAEVDHGGAGAPRPRPPGLDRGFLWRLNSYWRFLAVDGGVLVECETMSLSRDVPAGLWWLVGGYLESVPRESLERTLRAIRMGMPRPGKTGDPEAADR